MIMNPNTDHSLIPGKNEGRSQVRDSASCSKTLQCRTVSSTSRPVYHPKQTEVGSNSKAAFVLIDLVVVLYL